VNTPLAQTGGNVAAAARPPGASRTHICRTLAREEPQRWAE